LKNTALIVVDVQVEMFSDLDRPVYRGDELLRNVKCLIEKAHNSCTPVIYIQHTEDDDEPLGKGKPGWSIHPEITPLPQDITIMKYTPDSFHETNLHNLLSSKNVERIVITGLQTEYCIDTTCRRAFSLGYDTILVKDGHSTYDSKTLTASQIIEHHNRIIGNWFAKLMATQEMQFV